MFFLWEILHIFKLKLNLYYSKSTLTMWILSFDFWKRKLNIFSLFFRMKILPKPWRKSFLAASSYIRDHLNSMNPTMLAVQDLWHSTFKWVFLALESVFLFFLRWKLFYYILIISFTVLTGNLKSNYKCNISI